MFTACHGVILKCFLYSDAAKKKKKCSDLTDKMRLVSAADDLDHGHLGGSPSVFVCMTV